MENCRKQKILIADDSELNREILSAMLEDEYNIMEAENGTFFSLILVYFANLLLFLALLRLFNAVSLHRFLADCIHNAEKLWDVLRDLAMLAAGLFL